MRVALYARVSTKEQADLDLSIPDQLRQMRAWCEAENHLIVMDYVEPGASARDDNRPIFRQMMEDAAIKPPPFDALIVYTQSRFFRNSTDLRLHERTLNRNGISLISITQPINDDPSGNLLRGVIALLDEHTSAENSKHTGRAMRENARQGYWNGSVPPYGYRAVDAGKVGTKGRIKKKLDINPEEAAVVRRIYDWYIHGLNGRTVGMKEITSHLNTAGPSMRGSRWRVQKVQEILSQETYVGTHYFNRRDSRTNTVKPREEWVPFAVPAIVSAEVFEAAGVCRRTRAPSAAPGRRLASPHLLSGLLKCGHCGAGMSITTGKGSKYRYYKCTTKVAKSAKACPSKPLRMEKLDSLILEALSEQVLTPDAITAMLGDLDRQIRDKAKGAESELLALRSRLKETDQAISRLYDAIQKGIIDLNDTLTERSRNLQQNRTRLLEEIAKIEARQGLPFKATNKRHVAAFCRAVQNTLRNRESGFARSIVQKLVTKVEILGDQITITGDRLALAGAVAPDPNDNAKVRSYMAGWRTRQDSNL